MNLADRGNLGQAQHVLHSIEQGLQSLMVAEASDNGSELPSGSVAGARAPEGAAAMLGQLRADVQAMSQGFATDASYRQGGNAHASMVTRSHATQRSTHASYPHNVPSPPTMPQGSFGQATTAWTTAPQGTPVAPQDLAGPEPTAPPALPRGAACPATGRYVPPVGFLPRQRSTSGEAQGSPTKRTRTVHGMTANAGAGLQGGPSPMSGPQPPALSASAVASLQVTAPKGVTAVCILCQGGASKYQGPQHACCRGGMGTPAVDALHSSMQGCQG